MRVLSSGNVAWKHTKAFLSAVIFCEISFAEIPGALQYFKSHNTVHSRTRAIYRYSFDICIALEFYLDLISIIAEKLKIKTM